MASLRARLLAAVLALSAAGLLLLGGITYVEQRSFLLQRVDDQARAAPPAVARALSDQGVGPQLGEPDHERDEHRGGPPGDGPPPASRPPLGTYGERRDAAGRVIGGRGYVFGGQTSANPALPSDMPLDRLFTVKGRSGDENRYRVLAERDPAGFGTVVVAVPLREADQTLRRLLIVEGMVIAGVLVLLGVIARAVVRVGLLPLDRMGHTAGAIAGGDLSHRVEATDPRTEVGRLGISLNAMLDRLERAFSAQQASENRLRQFLADASHELRTPLASIRGYAELFRMGAARDPEETARAMSRIEGEAQRMGVLVEDLLTLARLDEIADAPHTELDVRPLVGDAVDDARATAPDRDITSSVGNGATTVRGDAHQLRQVLANLVRNALVHTPAGTPIELLAGRDDGEVWIEVRDHGPGLPPGDPQQLFERFWRSEGGRERGKAGAGLGLAIVAGIVDAHDGRVEARNAPDGGASFVVRLPAA